MERNNTYGELINNKFTELLSADKDQTWKGMKQILDREMPDRKRRWLNWFGPKSVIAIVMLFSLFAAANVTYNYLNHPGNPQPAAADKQPASHTITASVSNDRPALAPVTTSKATLTTQIASVPLKTKQMDKRETSLKLKKEAGNTTDSSTPRIRMAATSTDDSADMSFMLSQRKSVVEKRRAF